MTGAEIVHLIRAKLDDKVEPYGWSTLEIVHALNQALDEYAQFGLLIKDRDTESICRISIISGTAEYSLSQRIILINDPIWLTTLAKPIYEVTEDYCYAKYGKSWRTTTGEITDYIADRERKKIRFFPIPDANDTAEMDVYRSQNERFTEANIGSVSPDIDVDLHYNLVHGSIVHLYDKNDTDTRDFSSLTVAKSKWTEAIELAKRSLIKRRYREQRIVPSRGLIC